MVNALAADERASTSPTRLSPHGQVSEARAASGGPSTLPRIRTGRLVENELHGLRVSDFSCAAGSLLRALLKKFRELCGVEADAGRADRHGVGDAVDVDDASLDQSAVHTRPTRSIGTPALADYRISEPLDVRVTDRTIRAQSTDGHSYDSSPRIASAFAVAYRGLFNSEREKRANCGDRARPIPSTLRCLTTINVPSRWMTQSTDLSEIAENG